MGSNCGDFEAGDVSYASSMLFDTINLTVENFHGSLSRWRDKKQEFHLCRWLN